MRKKLIIDGNNLLHRAYWAFKKNEADYQNGSNFSVYIFFNILRSYVRLFEPSEVIVCWDYREENEINERKEILEEYKGQRPNSDDVYKYTNDIKNILSSLGIKQMFPKNFEADDIMYWLCAVKYPNECVLVTTDTDMYQLITPELSENIFYNPKKKMQINEVFLKQKFKAKNGLEFIIRKALRGDAADNIPGVKGIRNTRVEEVVECLCPEFDMLSLQKSNILKEEEYKIFERNIKLMKLDEILNHPSELEWYETQLNMPVTASKHLFKNNVKHLELWNVYRKYDKWFSDFQPKNKSIEENISNEYFNIFQSS